MDLSDPQLNSIKTQLARILEHMRVNGKYLTEHHPAFLQYDAAADKVYLVDFTFWTDIDPDNSDPIDEESTEVLAFNIWRDHLRENPVLWGTEPHPAPAIAYSSKKGKAVESKEQTASASSPDKGKKREGKESAVPPISGAENIRPGGEASTSRKGKGKESGRRPPWRH
ncbi:hypothetical protein HFD88_004159 [Aspergillus terreus]|nr:hypothetical protein HFD88_004159 [Aspergillus terreus]